jgi:aminoglycoside phosphotransferase (APT) family kinase protein
VRRYCERTGRGDPDAVMADWNFYMAYNLFRMAGILQGIAKRVVTARHRARRPAGRRRRAAAGRDGLAHRAAGPPLS